KPTRRNERNRPARSSVMSQTPDTARRSPAETKLVICVKHTFSEWCAKPMLAEAIRIRWPRMRVVHLPDYSRIKEELPDTHIFVGASLRVQQFAHAKQLQWIHSTAAGVSQLLYPELRSSGVIVTNPSVIFSVPMAGHPMGWIHARARIFPDRVG